MIHFLLSEVLPPPEVVIPAGAAIEAALGAVLAGLLGIIPGVKSAIIKAATWAIGTLGWPLVQLADWAEGLNVAVSGVRSWASNEIHGLVMAVSAIHPSTVVNVTANISGAVNALNQHINDAENYAISVAEGLYNRAVERTVTEITMLHGYVDGTAHNLQDNINHTAEQAAAYAGTLAGAVATHADVVASDALHAALGAVGALGGYVDGAVQRIEGEVADVRPWVAGAIGLAGAEVFARVITTVQSLYDPCCEFTTDTVKPKWNQVKNLLGKLTRRGPLVFVVLGAASEAVVSLDRPAIVAALKQAKAADGGTSLRVLKDWQRPGVA